MPPDPYVDEGAEDGAVQRAQPVSAACQSRGGIRPRTPMPMSRARKAFCGNALGRQRSIRL